MEHCFLLVENANKSCRFHIINSTKKHQNTLNIILYVICVKKKI